jgi:hypothetical protein
VLIVTICAANFNAISAIEPVARLVIATGDAMQIFNDLYYSNLWKYIVYLDAGLLA